MYRQYSIGICYETGRGVKEDKLEALKWYIKSADQVYSEVIDYLKKELLKNKQDISIKNKVVYLIIIV